MKLTVVYWTCLCLALLVSDGRSQSGPASKSTRSSSAEQPVKSAQPSGFPVKFQGSTLFLVQERVLSFSAEERARAIAARIERLARDPRIDRTPVTAVDGEASTDVVCGDLVMMSVTNRDAQLSGQARLALASTYARLIGEAVQTARVRYSPRRLLLAAAYALLATVILLVAVWLTGFLLRRVQAKLTSWRGTIIRSIDAPAGETKVLCVKGCTLQGARDQGNPNNRPVPEYRYGCSGAPRCGATVNGWLTR